MPLESGPPPAEIEAPTLDDAGVALVPAWLRRLAAIGWRVLATITFAAVLITVAAYLSTVTSAILVGLIVAAIFAPMDRYLRVERGWARASAAAATSLIALGTVILVVLLVVLAFVPYLVDLIRAGRSGFAVLVQGLQNAGAPGGLLDLIRGLVDGVEVWLSTALTPFVGHVAALATVLILGGFLTFYLLEDGDRAWMRATADLAEWRKDALTDRGLRALGQVGDYLRGTAVMAVTRAVTALVFFLLLGVPLAGPLAVLVLLSGFVPYLGAVFAAVVLSLVTLAARGVLAVVVLLALLVATSIFENRVLSRYAFARTIGIHPALVLIVLTAAAALFGVVGLFAAVPVLTAAVAVMPGIVEALGTSPAPAIGRALAPSAALVPIWLDRLGQWSWRSLVVLALLVLTVQLIAVPLLSAPVIIALVIACAMKPSAELLRARGAGPTRAALIVTLASATTVAGVLLITIASLARQMPEVLAEASSGASRAGLGAAPVDVVRAVAPSLLASVAALVGNAAGLTVVLVTAGLLAFFFLRDGPRWWSQALDNLSPNRRRIVGAAGATAARIVNGATIGTGVVSLFGAAAQWLTMSLLGLPLAFPIAVLTFFGGFVPYIGSFITTGIGFLVAVAVGDTADIVLMGLFTVVFNIVQGNFVAPLVYGRTVNLHPAIVLLAAPIGAALGGLVGMIMIVPLLGIIAATWRSIIHLFDVDEEMPASIPPEDVAPAEPSAVAAPPRTAPAAGLSQPPLS